MRKEWGACAAPASERVAVKLAEVEEKEDVEVGNREEGDERLLATT